METLFQKHQDFFNSNQTKSYAFRKQQLEKLRVSIQAYEKKIIEALYLDLHKSSFEAYSTEIGFNLYSIRHALKSLKKWMRPKKVKTPIFQLNTKSFIEAEPLGTVLIIGPYNYPFQLVIEPLIGAIAAGNTAFIKPSEFTIHTSKVIEDMIKSTFDPSYITVVQGDYQVTDALLNFPFDHIFFTGSTRVGKIIYEKASKNLIPVTLELGGKSPTIVDETANLKVAAKRIAFGKFINAGQTCIAPDYVYVHHLVYESFLQIFEDLISHSYDDEKQIGRIINDRHFNRLKNLIQDDQIVNQKKLNKEDKFIGPLMLRDVTWQDPVMQEEIFGPILPFLVYENLDHVIQTIKSQDKPLALYLFSENKQTQKRIFSELSFGGGAINDTIMHITSTKLPFGGVGMSGIGAYHGKYSFDVFSHQKSYIKRATWLDLPITYPPFNKKKEQIIRRVLK
jgi:aldehyde dehydrogenase (NAD+)